MANLDGRTDDGRVAVFCNFVEETGWTGGDVVRYTAWPSGASRMKRKGFLYGARQFDDIASRQDL